MLDCSSSSTPSRSSKSRRSTGSKNCKRIDGSSRSGDRCFSEHFRARTRGMLLRWCSDMCLLRVLIWCWPQRLCEDHSSRSSAPAAHLPDIFARSKKSRSMRLSWLYEPSARTRLEDPLSACAAQLPDAHLHYSTSREAHAFGHVRLKRVSLRIVS